MSISFNTALSRPSQATIQSVTLQSALNYDLAGFSQAPILLDGSKQAAQKWKELQSRRPERSELLEWYSQARFGIGLIHGPISNNSEVIDIDDYDTGMDFWRKARLEFSELEGTPIVETPRPGLQIYTRLTAPPPGNLVLSKCPDRAKPGKWKTLIETRGAGGYTVAPGSPPAVHSTGRPCKLISGSFRTIATLTAERRGAFRAFALAYNQRPPVGAKPERHIRMEGADHQDKGSGGIEGDRPGDCFNRQACWPQILEPHGWRSVGRCNAVSFWRRPGKSEGHSATTNYADSDLLYVFSSNADPFEAEQAYTKFAADPPGASRRLRKSGIATTSMGVWSMSGQADQATEALRTKLEALKLETIDDLSFQANYKEWAKEIPCDIAFIKSEWKRARAKRAAELKAPREKSDPWASAQFTLLGVRGEDIYFHDHITNQVLVGPPTKQRLLQLEDDNFFYSIAPGAKERINWDAAIAEVSMRAKKQGIFDPSRIRGRGAWLDEIAGTATLVLNCGDRLLVDGKTLPLGQSGRYVFVAGVPCDIKLPPPLTVEGAAPVRDLFGALRWRNPALDSLLLQGFLVVAQVAGALSWRPHLWLSSASQSGKTTLRQRAIEPLMPFRFTPAFGVHSTEAGIRQSLGGDSLVWTLDESEPEAGGSNVRKILAMLRSNSSSSFEERTVKGTTHACPPNGNESLPSVGAMPTPTMEAATKRWSRSTDCGTQFWRT
jgi:hypothetical protein